MKLLILVLTFIFISCGNDLKIPHGTAQLRLGSALLRVEVMDTPRKRYQGLRFREELKSGWGMLFVFPAEGMYSFTMKNTKIPLDIGFFSKERSLIQILRMTPYVEGPYTPENEFQFALEVPEGFFEKNKIKEGERFEIAPGN